MLINRFRKFRAPAGEADGGDTVVLDMEAEKAAAVARGDVVPDDESKTADQQAEELDKGGEPEAKDDDTETETPEEKAEREAEEAAAAKIKTKRIPLERHEKIVDNARKREEQLVARIAQLEAGVKQAPAQRKDVMGEMKTQISTLQDSYEELVFEGKKDEAKAVRVQLEALRDRYTDAKVAMSGNQAREQTIDTLKFEAALAKVEADYSELNPNHDSFSDAKADEVAELLTMFMEKGFNRQVALGKAVKYVMGDAKAKAEPDTAAKALADKRAEEARKKAADASKRQPPNGQVVGQDNDKAGNKNGDKIDVMRMTQEQFAKLDEDTLARQRGDML